MRSTDPRALLLLTRAWLWGIVRDRAAIFWFFVLPLLFVVVFGLAFGRSDAGSYDVGLAVDETTPTGQALVQAFRSVKPFDLTVGTAEQQLNQLRQGRLYAVVTLEPSPSASTAPITASRVVVHYDPSRAVAAQIVLPIIQQVVDGVDRELSGRPPALTVEQRSVRSSSLRYIDFFLPGIIAFQVMQGTLFAAIPMVQLRTTRVLKRFGATPVPRWTVLASQGLARLIMALASALVLMLAGRLLFGIQVGANWPGMLGFIVAGAVAFLAIGFAISGLAPTAESVPALVQVVSFPMMFLSGVFFPVETFPAFLEPLIRVLPLTFLADGLRQTMVGGAPLQPLWLDYVALLAWLAAGSLLAVRVFKWE